MITLNSYIQEYDKGLAKQEQQENQQEQELRELKAEIVEELESIKDIYNLELTTNEMLEVSDYPTKTSLTTPQGHIKDWEYYYTEIENMTKQEWKDLENEYLN